MTFNDLKILFCTVIGIIGTAIANLFGGWTSDMATLLIFMTVDFVMGLIVAGIFKNSDKSENGALDSQAGWKGLAKKSITLLFVLVAHRLDITLGTSYIRTAAIIAFITNELISITENAGLMGIPIPKPVMSAIDVLKLRSDKDGD